MTEEYVVGDREVIARFEKMTGAFSKELGIGINRLTVNLQRNVKQNKLSGQVLGVRTGTGRRSVNQTVQQQGDKVVGIVSTAVGYMVGWEQGWPGGGARASLDAAKAKFSTSASTDRFKNGTAKQRAFLVPSLREMESSGEIKKELADAVQRAKA